WSYTGDMNNGRSDHASTVLTNENVLVVGEDDNERNAAEIHQSFSTNKYYRYF
ncbi:unnamed protein product, partial [Rotaria sp. Silwood2]